jgi:hypothetical protein
MPDLEQQTVTEWLTGFCREAAARDWPPAIRPIEIEASQQLAALGTALDQAAERDLPDLSAALHQAPLGDDLHTILAQLGTARLLRLLHWLSETDTPECHAVVTALVAGEDASGRALRAALNAAIRHTVLHRMFAPERVAALEDACRATFTEVT